MSRYSGAGAGDRTMLDAILPAVEALQAHSGEGSSPCRAARVPSAAAFCLQAVRAAYCVQL